MSGADAELVALFREEAAERLDRMVEAALSVEQGRAGPGTADALMREAHTIKGSAAMIGMDDVRALAHALEDVLDVCRSADAVPPEFVGPLLRAVDALREGVVGGGAGHAAVLAELADWRERVAGGDSAAPAASEPQAAPPHAVERPTVRVRAEKLDRLVDLAGESALHRRRLEHVLGGANGQAVDDELGVGQRLLDELVDSAIDLRTLPLAAILGPLPRAVRDAAAASGKEVDLVTRGEGTELDRAVLEGLADPLVHLLRNAVAHGIEPPEERARAGKARRGRIELAAEPSGSHVRISVSDDGRGVAPEIQARAEAEGSLVEVLARAGFSTAGGVSDLAGRGVGLDAVKTHVESIGGLLEAHSEPGRGSEFVLRVPLTLAVLPVFLAERGGRVLGVPLAAVEEAVLVESRTSLAGRVAIDLRGRSVSVADLSALMGLSAPPPPPRAPAIVVSAGGRRLAALCDRLLGGEDVVLKPLGPLLAGVEGLLGAAILGDGRIAIILDPVRLVQQRQAPEASPPSPQARPAASGTVLVVEDSLAIRELQRSILETAGYEVITAGDGREALERLQGDREVDLVVTDVEMPAMDGLELTRAIRADAERSSLPVVVVTSRGGDEDRRRGMEAGADAYVTKGSFDQRALLGTVERLVGR